MAKTKVKKESAIIRYFRDTRAELRKVHWPSREETWRLTQIVLVVTLSMAAFLGLLDWVFDRWLGGILESNPWSIGLAIAILAFSIVAGVLLGRQED